MHFSFSSQPVLHKVSQETSDLSKEVEGVEKECSALELEQERVRKECEGVSGMYRRELRVKPLLSTSIVFHYISIQ